MTFVDVLRHQWLWRWRSYTWSRHLAQGLLLALTAVQIGLLFVIAGCIYPDVVAELAPETDPLRLLNRYLLTGFAGLLVMRFFLQRPVGSAVRPYLPLPVPQSHLVRLMQATSTLSLFNILPLVLLFALWLSTVLPSSSTLAAGEWGVGVLLATAATQFATSVLRAAWERSATVVLGIVGGIGAGLFASVTLGPGGLLNASDWIFGGMSAGRLWPLLVGAATTAGLAIIAHRMLRAQLYEVFDTSDRPRAGVRRLPGAAWVRGAVMSLALLDVNLILRNRRSRQLLLAGTLLVGALLVAVTYKDASLPPILSATLGFLVSGNLGLSYSQFGYAWHGRHFDCLLSQAIRPRTVVRAQFVTFTGLCVLLVTLMVPIVVILAPRLLVSVGAFLLYNIGVAAPMLLGLGIWSRKALELNQSTFFNYQGTSTQHFLVLLPVMGFPLGLVLWLGMSTALLIASGLGGFGIATTPLWTRGLGRLLHRRRYAMAKGFRRE